MKHATWNVNSQKVRLPQVLGWLASNPVDALCLQETKLVDEKFPVAELEAAGYRALFSGQPTYNGVAILSRGPLRDVQAGIPGFADDLKRILAATVDAPGGPILTAEGISAAPPPIASRKGLPSLGWSTAWPCSNSPAVPTMAPLP